MELASAVNESIVELIKHFDMPVDEWGPQWWYLHRVNDFTNRSWRFEMDSRVTYDIYYDKGSPAQSHFRLRKGIIERFYKDGYTLFAQKHTSYGTCYITFTILNNALCNEENSVRWSK